MNLKLGKKKQSCSKGTRREGTEIKLRYGGRKINMALRKGTDI